MKQKSGIYVLKAGSKKKFLLLEGRNRPTDEKHVREMIDSLKLYGQQLRPIIVARLPWLGRGYYVIDGQHLYCALCALGWDIEYKIVKVKDSTDLVTKLAMINSSSKPWNLHDYIRAWAIENENYRKLAAYYPQFTLDICNLSSLLSGHGPVSGGGSSKYVKKGLFEIVEEEKTVAFLKNLQDILDLNKMKKSSDTRYVACEYYNLMAVTQDYNHKEFLSKLKKDTVKLRVATAVPGELFK